MEEVSLLEWNQINAELIWLQVQGNYVPTAELLRVIVIILTTSSNGKLYTNLQLRVKVVVSKFMTY